MNMDYIISGSSLHMPYYHIVKCTLYKVKKNPNTPVLTDCILQDWVNYFFPEPFESEMQISWNFIPQLLFSKNKGNSHMAIRPAKKVSNNIINDSCPVLLSLLFLWIKANCLKLFTVNVDAFQLWCWRKLLRVPWMARSSNQSIIKEISPEYSLEGLMLKLKLQSFGHLMWRTGSFEKTLILGKIEGRWRRECQRMKWLMASPTWWTWVWVSSRSWCWTGRPGVLQSMGLQRVRHD